MTPPDPATPDAPDELRRHAERLRASEERYRAFIENSAEGIWRLEFDPPIDTSLPVDEQVDRAYANGRFAECNLVGPPAHFLLRFPA